MAIDIKQFADTFGLNPYSAKIYLGLASEGPSNVTQIARATSFPRTAIYGPLKSLIAKGYVGSVMMGRRKLYQAIQPERMKYVLAQRLAVGSRLLDEIINAGIVSSPNNNLRIQYFEGAQGIAVAGQILLDESKDKTWHSFENTASVIELVSLDYKTNYVKERIKHGIHVRTILTADAIPTWLKESFRRNEEELRETLILSPNQFNFSSTIEATREMVLLVNTLENPFAVLIHNRHLAATLINIHKIIWGQYKM